MEMMSMMPLVASRTVIQNGGDDNHLVVDGVARSKAIWTDRISYVSSIEC